MQRKTRPFLPMRSEVVEDRAGRIQLDGDGNGQQQRRKENQAPGLEKTISKHALEEQADLGHMAAVQRNGRKLADVFDGAVPGQAVVHVGNHAQIHAMHAGLLQHVLHDSALAGRGEEDLIHKLLAGVLEERVESAHHVAGSCGMNASRSRETR